MICGEDKIVAVHHYDHNHYNNDPANLVPLCPTHHQYVHSRYKDEVKSIIDDYVRKFRGRGLLGKSFGLEPGHYEVQIPPSRPI